MAIFVKFLSSIVGGLVAAMPTIMNSHDFESHAFASLFFVMGSFGGLIFGKLIVGRSAKPTLPPEVK